MGDIIFDAPLLFFVFIWYTMLSNKTLRVMKVAAPFALAALIALVTWIYLRKERYDSGCDDEYPTKGARPETQGKCCRAKYSRVCKDTGTCPAEYPFLGGRKDGSNAGKCCKGRHSNRCQGGSSAPAPSGSPSPAPGPAPTCQWFQTYDAARGQCTGCPPAQKWDGGKNACVYDDSVRVEVRDNAGFSGEKSLYKVGDYASMGIFGNDIMSSLKIPKGLKVTLYSDSNFGGSQLTLDANDHTNLGHFEFPSGQWKGKDVCGGGNKYCWNDSVSSMKVYLA
jgi:hypothetical protein